MVDRRTIEPVDLAEELIEFVKPELHPGERLLWAASSLPRPPAGVRSPIPPIALTVASFGLCGGAFFVCFGPLRPRFLSVEPLLLATGVIAMIVGLLFAVVTVYARAERWWRHGRFLANTYALTDRRAIIWVPQLGTKAVEVHTFAKGTIKVIHRLEYPDGSGSVRFAGSLEDYYGGPGGFEGVADVRFVEDLARRTLVDPGRMNPA